MAINNKGCFPLIALLCYTKHDAQRQHRQHLLSNYIVNIIDDMLCFTTTHFLYDQVTITQTVSPFSFTTHIYTIFKLNAIL